MYNVELSSSIFHNFEYWYRKGCFIPSHRSRLIHKLDEVQLLIENDEVQSVLLSEWYSALSSLEWLDCSLGDREDVQPVTKQRFSCCGADITCSNTEKKVR